MSVCDRFQELSGREEKVRVGWLAKMLISSSEGFINQDAVGRKAAEQIRKQRTMEIVGDDNARESSGIIRPDHIVALKIKLAEGDARPCGGIQCSRIAVNGEHRKSETCQQVCMATGTAGKVEHLPGRYQARKPLHPGGWISALNLRRQSALR